jgi:HPr kinase/phosphorylase
MRCPAPRRAARRGPCHPHRAYDGIVSARRRHRLTTGEGTAGSALLHASCAELHGRGILLLGRSGSGKSRLLRSILQAGGRLVADDQVRLAKVERRLRASAVALPGHLEVRGQGVYTLAYRPSVVLDLAVRLGAPVPGRLPEAETERLLEVDLPLIRFGTVGPTAAARLALALLAGRVATRP